MQRNTSTTLVADAPFSAERRRQELREQVAVAERELSQAADALREYQGQNYSTTIDAGHRERVFALSRAHDAFQAALKSFSEAC